MAAAAKRSSAKPAVGEAAMRHKPSSQCQRGFTLIEVLVALALSATVLGLTSYALRAMATTGGRGIDVMNRLDMTARGATALRRDLVRLGRVFETLRTGQRFVFSGSRRELSFVVVEPSFPTEAGTYKLQYRVRKTGDVSQLVRSRSVYETGAVGREPRRQHEEEAIVVMEGPYDFAFSFQDFSGGKAQWTNRWQDHARLPVLIRVEGQSLTPRTPGLVPIIVRPRIDAEAGCSDASVRVCTPRTGGSLSEARGTESSGSQAAPATSASPEAK